MLGKIAEWVRRYPEYRTLPALIEEERGGGLKESVVVIIIAQLLSFSSLLVAVLLKSASSPAYSGSLSVLLPGLVQLSLIGLVLFYLICGMMYAFAKVAGGKGGLGSQAYVLAIFSLCNNVVSFPLVVLSQLPQLAVPLPLLPITVGGIFELVVLAVGFYGVYAQAQTMRVIHQISWFRTAAIMVVTWLILLFLTVLTLRLAGGGAMAGPV